MSVKENLDRINKEILEYKKEYNNSNVKLIAVSKFHSVEEILQAIEYGQTLFGENRVQEACSKFSLIKEKNINFDLHFIGQLQTNKVKDIIPYCSCIQSVDRLSVLYEIEKQCKKINKKINILFEYHTGEESKSGFKTEEEIFSILTKFINNEFFYIKPIGFMTMAPFTQDKILIHQSFSKLRNLKEKANRLFPTLSLNELSMGMSNDFNIAIEEGATMVRIGTSIFGERKN